MPLPVHYEIVIEVDPANLIPPPSAPGYIGGNFVFRPALLRVRANDTITWKCAHPFTIYFKGTTPVDDMEIFGDTGSTLPAKVQDVKGHFHYAVAVWTGARIFMDASCAGISVN
jgi:hypothetical protein